MCLTCAAAETALLSEVERLVVLAESDAGLGDPAARRPLSGPERAAMVRFGEITAVEDGFLASVTPILDELRGVVDAEILAALAGAGSARALMDALEALTAAQPPAVAQQVAQATNTVSAALEDVYRASSKVAIGEARRQGVTLLPSVLDPAPGAYDVAARRVAAEPWARALEVTRKQVTGPEVLVGEVLDADLVPAALANYSNAGVVDLARQFGHTALGGGRYDTYGAIPYAARYYASELRDSNACVNCLAIDGKDYDTLAEARADYEHGPMVRCLGSLRCRGSLVAVFE